VVYDAGSLLVDEASEATRCILETTTTTLRPGIDSIAARAADYAAQLGMPEAQAEASLLDDHPEPPPVEDIRDPEQVIPPLRDVYGPFAEVLDLELIAADLQDPCVEGATTPSSRRRSKGERRSTAWTVGLVLPTAQRRFRRALGDETSHPRWPNQREQALGPPSRRSRCARETPPRCGPNAVR
jgi:hypothetical protein